ncbi:ester cyclase [Streptomyces sp. NBC_01310]|uniref:ester cyclase n=1 Tax=Streptomyces sp. NBC_01310 TaxID=2903820 RepID=UPI0035B572D7|nr:ester cyclase [Streptomyces sp. NBC_01310]
MMGSAIEKNLDMLRAAYRKLECADLDACVEMLAEDFVANVPGAPDPLHGREVWRLGAQAMLDGFPDLQIDVEEMFGAGDKVAVRVQFRGTHRGTFQGVAATGREVGFRSVEIYRIEDEKIAEEWVAPDLISLMQQISPPLTSV